jgi:hypothetical protein
MKVFWITCEYAWNLGSILDSLIMLGSRRIILDIMRQHRSTLDSRARQHESWLDGM